MRKSPSAIEPNLDVAEAKRVLKKRLRYDGIVCLSRVTLAVDLSLQDLKLAARELVNDGLAIADPALDEVYRSTR